MPGTADNNEVLFYHQANRKEAVQVALTGVAVGILIPLIGLILSQLVLKPLFCQNADGAACGSTEMIGYYVSTVLVTGIAIPVLANWGVFRGLIVAISSAIALWGLQGHVTSLATGNFFEYLLFSAILFGAAYVLFYWLMRLRNFGWGLVLALVVVLAIRWVLIN
jgi:hypothetical protein